MGILLRAWQRNAVPTAVNANLVLIKVIDKGFKGGKSPIDQAA
jgi:hypothetical protein